jgi:hypothetical protein
VSEYTPEQLDAAHDALVAEAKARRPIRAGWAQLEALHPDKAPEVLAMGRTAYLAGALHAVRLLQIAADYSDMAQIRAAITSELAAFGGA